MTLSAQPAHATSCSDSSPNALLGTRISTNRTQTERSGLSRKYPPPPEPHEAERAPQIPLPATRAGTGHRTRCPRGHPSTRAAGTPSPSNGAAPTPRPEPAVPAPPLAGISAAVPHSGRHPYGVRKPRPAAPRSSLPGSVSPALKRPTAPRRAKWRIGLRRTGSAAGPTPPERRLGGGTDSVALPAGLPACSPLMSDASPRPAAPFAPGLGVRQPSASPLCSFRFFFTQTLQSSL